MTTITVRRGKTAGIPFHQERAPVPLLLAPEINRQGIAEAIAQRVHLIGRSRSCCAYVFVRDGRVYVLSEDSGMAHRWAVQHTAEWVGCYGGLVDLVVLLGDLEGMLPCR